MAANRKGTFDAPTDHRNNARSGRESEWQLLLCKWTKLALPMSLPVRQEIVDL